MLVYSLWIRSVKYYVYNIERKLGWRDPNELKPAFSDPESLQECEEILDDHWPKIVKAREWMQQNTECFLKVRFPSDEQPYPDDHDYRNLTRRCEIAKQEAFKVWYCIGGLSPEHRTELGKFSNSFSRPNDTPLFEYKASILDKKLGGLERPKRRPSRKTRRAKRKVPVMRRKI